MIAATVLLGFVTSGFMMIDFLIQIYVFRMVLCKTRYYKSLAAIENLTLLDVENFRYF